jgi:hypothetical protein
VEKYLEADTLPTPAKERSITGEHNVIEQVVETLASSAPNAECNLCEAARKARITARKATCPDCNYNGYYVHTDDKLCPACKAARENPPVEKVAKKKPTVKVVVPKVKAPMNLHVSVRTSGDSPKTGSVVMISLTCTRAGESFPESSHHWYITPEQVPAVESPFWINNWADRPMLWNHIMKIGTPAETAVSELSKLLTDLSSSYDICMLGCDKWLEHVYNKYTFDNKFPLSRLF